MISGAALLQNAELARLSVLLRERRHGSQATDAGAPEDASVRNAAVALILRPTLESGDLEMLLIQRAVWASDPWSGQVALPGGRSEPADASLEHTAIRETLEETGVDLARDGMLLGALDEVRPRTPVLPPIVVHPFVFAAPPDLTLTPSAEVADAFWVSLAALRSPDAECEATVVVRGEERRVTSYRCAGRVVWGLTERVIRQLIELAA